MQRVAAFPSHECGAAPRREETRVQALPSQRRGIDPHDVTRLRTGATTKKRHHYAAGLLLNLHLNECIHRSVKENPKHRAKCWQTRLNL